MGAPSNRSIILFVLIGVFLVVFVGILALLIVVILRAYLATKPVLVEKCNYNETMYMFVNNEVLERFIDAIRCQTISFDRYVGNTTELLKFQDLIVKSFPAIHSSPFVHKEVVNNFSLLYTIKGKNDSLPPYMLTSHLDVVPVNQDKWSVPAFDGTVKDGYIYGRGTIDDKHSVMGILEALEFLLKTGFRPERTFYLAFGHDEEVNGIEGAQKITELLYERGVQIDFILDEGLFVLDGVLPGLSSPVALIGVTEKGYVTVELTVESPAGHSSVPPAETSIGILSHALSKLQHHPQPNLFSKGPEAAMFQHLAPYTPAQHAMVRTTTAITVVRGGIKENVIPALATALVNHRIHPSHTVKEVVDFDVRTINDGRVQVKVVEGFEPHFVSRYDGRASGYWAVHKSIRQVFHDVVVAPGVMVANTDSRWYKTLTSNVYRFTPVHLFGSDIARFHGDDERISIENYEKVINFYIHMIMNANEGHNIDHNDAAHVEL